MLYHTRRPTGADAWIFLDELDNRRVLEGTFEDSLGLTQTQVSLALALLVVNCSGCIPVIRAQTSTPSSTNNDIRFIQNNRKSRNRLFGSAKSTKYLPGILHIRYSI